MGYGTYERTNVDVLKGKIFSSVKYNKKYNEIVFITADDDVYKMCHIQDCCESVVVEDICGDLNSLVGVPLIEAEEVSNRELFASLQKESFCAESCLWTFYIFRTIKGDVTMRWYGESNGYYSESVDIIKINKKD